MIGREVKYIKSGGWYEDGEAVSAGISADPPIEHIGYLAWFDSDIGCPGVLIEDKCGHIIWVELCRVKFATPTHEKEMRM